jgi:hypothetical protein
VAKEVKRTGGVNAMKAVAGTQLLLDNLQQQHYSSKVDAEDP